MDSQYDQIYRGLFDAPAFAPRVRTPDEGQLEDTIKKTILEENERISGVGGLRADAQYFLLRNFFDMLALPAAAHPGDDYQYNQGPLSADIRQVVQAAAERQTRTGRRDGVSAHAIVVAVAERWNDLNLTKVLSWGAEQQFDEAPPAGT